MPYRRLPNTDNSRLKALKIALDKGKDLPPSSKPYSSSSLYSINIYLPKYEALLILYKESFKKQTEKSPEYTYLYKKARNYVSHFIQVLNLSIIRGDLKSNARTFFNINAKKLPAFKTEKDLLKWGEIVLEGEQQRIRKGGNPMTNPTVGIVRVHFDNFKEAHRFQKVLQENTNRASKNIAEIRKEIDGVILKLWNDIEIFYESYDDVEKRNLCRDFGVNYFFRRNETIPVEENVSKEYREKRIVNKDIIKTVLPEEEIIEDLNKGENLQYSLF